MSRIHEALKKADAAFGETITDSAIRIDDSQPMLLETALTEPSVRDGEGGSGQIPEITIQGFQPWELEPSLEPNAELLLDFDSSIHFAATEQFRRATSRLHQVRAHRELKSVLITSALPAEGKSFVASNLAMALARCEEDRVLLIDADLRSPILHRLFGASVAPGLADFLDNKAALGQLLKRGTKENFFLMPAGKSSKNPAELLARDTFSNLMQELASMFDWIILDSPPALPVADSIRIAEHCDGVLVVARAGKTPLNAAAKIQKEFRGGSLLACILNGAAHPPKYSAYYHNQQGNTKNEKQATE